MISKASHSIISVLRSNLYRDIWKFTFIGGGVGGLLVFLSGAIMWGLGQLGDTILLAAYMSLYGFAMGLVAGIIGFPIMYLIGKWATPSQFAKLAILLGLGLALGVSLSFIEGMSMERVGFSTAIFPGIPIVGGVYYFRYFALKIILPYSTKK